MPQEILTEIQVPLPQAGAGSAYERLAYRSAIDYPVVCAAASLEMEGRAIRRARLVIGAMSNAPLPMAQSAVLLEESGNFREEALDRAASIAMDHASAFAVENVGATVEYRGQMVRALAMRALRRAAARAQ
jgi:CO/xanthine dehydrogenase FAD-binding subunit